MTTENKTAETTVEKTHEQKMIEVADAHSAEAIKAGTAPVIEKPAEAATVPDKFKNADGSLNTAALLASYSELEKKQGAPKVEDKPAVDPAKVDEKPAADPEAAAADVVTSAGLKMEDLQTKFDTSGKLDDSDYTALASKGIPKEMVDDFIAGRVARRDNYSNAIYAEAGTADSYAAMVAWAKDGLTTSEKQAFNSAIDSGDVAKAKFAVSGLAAKYTKANGKEPTLITPEVTTSTGDVFRSQAEVTKAMQDPRYKKDSAYRADVAAKLARSKY